MKRINSIDFVRGLVMVIMALDHVRDLMHVTSLTQDPTNVATTTPFIFFTRWITHLCAPTFVLLSGTSAYISLKNSQNVAASRTFLLTRGIWLIVLEFTVINFGIWWDIHFDILMLQVIGAIGAGLVILSLLLTLPPRAIGAIGIVIIVGHNLLDGFTFPEYPVLDNAFFVLFRPKLFALTPNFKFLVSYPLLPWAGILLTGFACGTLFEASTEQRKKVFLWISIASLALFSVLRFSNVYGDPAHWASQQTGLFTFLSFINVTKYPPSLLFVLATLGITFLVLSFMDGVKNRMTDIISVYGKVPLFYYLIHWYLIHTVMFAMVFLQGFGINDLQFGAFNFGRPRGGGSGVELWAIYLIWFCIVASLYPLCKWYGRYKETHKERRFLRYL
jgi:uncharacterized membrane protein